MSLEGLIRIHRATDDPCEAERSNAAAGDAIADGALLLPSMKALDNEPKRTSSSGKNSRKNLEHGNLQNTSGYACRMPEDHMGICLPL